jgi:hypothetical protein
MRRKRYPTIKQWKVSMRKRNELGRTDKQRRVLYVALGTVYHSSLLKGRSRSSSLVATTRLFFVSLTNQQFIQKRFLYDDSGAYVSALLL